MGLLRTGLVMALAAVAVILIGCGEQVKAPDPEIIPLYRDVTVHFTPDDSTLYDSPFASARDKGRIMSTYREMESERGPAQVMLRLEIQPIRKDIRNMVDRWDRAGWIRLVKPGMNPLAADRATAGDGHDNTGQGNGVQDPGLDVARPLPGQADRRASCHGGLRMNCEGAQS